MGGFCRTCFCAGRGIACVQSTSTPSRFIFILTFGIAYAFFIYLIPFNLSYIFQNVVLIGTLLLVVENSKK